MEMKAMEVEAGLLDKAGPSDENLETKTEAKEASKEYCKLNYPTDDIYSEAVFPSPKPPEVKPTKQARSRRNVLPILCIVLGVICLAELIIILILNGKTAPTPVCPDPQLQRGTVACRFPCFKNPNTHNTAKSPDSHRCPDSWVFFKDFCYYRSNLRKSWAQGRTFCQNLTGDLAVISSEGIQNFLMQEIRVSHWIGLQYDKHWKWVDQTQYQGNLSTNNEKFCAALRGKPHGNLESASCLVSAHFICQKKAS